jgi:hypothetical protein
VDYKHTIINKVHTILVETISAKTRAGSQQFRQYLEKKFPAAQGDFLLLYRDIENDYYYISSGEKIRPEEGYGNLSKIPWQSDSWRNWD